MPATIGQDDVKSCISFPDDPFFSKLLAVANQRGKATVICEKADCIQADYNQLLHDVHALRQSIQSRLQNNLLDDNGIVKEEGFYIVVLVQGGYKFLVACIAIIAIGAAVVPLSK